MDPFEIIADTERSLLRMTLRGYWDDATFTAFSRQFLRAVATLVRHGDWRYTLVDGRDFMVQSVAISDRFALLIARTVDSWPERVATVVSGTLSKMQSDHAGVEHARYFNDLAAAEQWLFAEPAQAAARKSA